MRILVLLDPCMRDDRFVSPKEFTMRVAGGNPQVAKQFGTTWKGRISQIWRCAVNRHSLRAFRLGIVLVLIGNRRFLWDVELNHNREVHTLG